ncbi:hypothetical protein FACS189418_8040 [Clostridia bacterium]|nr:hypothetical protein FACS189418_8040 [Clostridia bacterium]
MKIRTLLFSKILFSTSERKEVFQSFFPIRKGDIKYWTYFKELSTIGGEIDHQFFRK